MPKLFKQHPALPQGFSDTFEARFWAQVNKTDSCWLWIGATQKGYGAINKGARTSGLIRAHQASWILHNGTIPEGMSVLHHCDVPACIRPDHLWIGTQKDNMHDAVHKSRTILYGKRILSAHQAPVLGKQGTVFTNATTTTAGTA